MPKKAHPVLNDRARLKAMIDLGLSQAEIAQCCDTKATNVAYYVGKHGLVQDLNRSDRFKQALKEKYPGGRKGPLAGNWRGGRMSTTGSKPGGYIRIWMPDHPAAHKGGYVYEHRLVMEKKLGRYLKPGEIIDHFDRNRSNNAPENLRLQSSRSAHVKDHFSARDRLVKALEKLRRYEELFGPLPD